MRLHHTCAWLTQANGRWCCRLVTLSSDHSPCLAPRCCMHPARAIPWSRFSVARSTPVTKATRVREISPMPFWFVLNKYEFIDSVKSTWDGCYRCATSRNVYPGCVCMRRCSTPRQARCCHAQCLEASCLLHAGGQTPAAWAGTSLCYSGVWREMTILRCGLLILGFARSRARPLQVIVVCRYI